MNDLLERYIKAQNYEKITEDCIAWIRSWFEKNGSDSPAVIGISGGKDSTAVAALCAEALGKDRVFGVLMPNGVQPDIDVSRAVVKHLGIKSAEVNIRDGFLGIENAVISGLGCGELSRQTVINLAPRLRMAAQYAVSQSLNGRVSNNSNRSEKYVGYSTIFGDSAGDFSPLSDLTVTEVRIVGRILGLPAEFVEKPPSDGLSSRTDEDAFGFTYEDLDTYILTGECENEITRQRIEQRHRANLFKLQPMAAFRKEG